MRNVVIVEDEECIRDGIVNLIDWKSLNCKIVFESSNGCDVLEYISKNQVDIIVSDIKMPVMDGLALLKEVGTHYPDIQLIILTAYSRFDYAQKAIREGAVDFVIKNDFIEELPKSILNAIKKIEQKDKEFKSKTLLSELELKKVKSYILESVALSGNYNIADIKKYDLDQKKYCICSCEIPFYNKDLHIWDIVKMIEDFINITVKPYDYYIINIKSNGFSIILSTDKLNDIKIDDIVDICSKIALMAKEFMDICILFGLSLIVEEVACLDMAFIQSEIALSRIADKSDKLSLYKELIYSEEIYSDEIKNKVSDLLFENNYRKSIDELSNLKKKMIMNNRPFDKNKIDIIHLCSIILQKLENYDIENLSEKEKEIYQVIQSCKTIYSLFIACENLINYSVDKIKNQKKVKSYIVNKIDQYIRENYADNITLDDISNALNVSKSYICRVYKSKTGVTLSDSINKYRIERAKTLLEDPKYKIYEIGEKVGIEDAPYFTNLFKKYVGCPPSDYRNKYL